MIRTLFVFAFMLYLPAISVGANVTEIQWEDLIPGLPESSDPLAELTEEERGAIEWVIYIRSFLVKDDNPDYQDALDEMKTVIAELKKKGIDVDAIVADRKFRNSAVNTELDGVVIRLAGYLLPLDLSGNTVTDFLLVPYVGACIHTPPPPPNQIVHAVSATPTSYELNELFKPVSVTGRLNAKSLSKELFLVDGSSDVNIGYSMSVDKIEDYRP